MFRQVGPALSAPGRKLFAEQSAQASLPTPNSRLRRSLRRAMAHIGEPKFAARQPIQEFFNGGRTLRRQIELTAARQTFPLRLVAQRRQPAEQLVRAF